MRRVFLYVWIAVTVVLAGCRNSQDLYAVSNRISVAVEVEPLGDPVVSKSTPASYISTFAAAVYDSRGDRVPQVQIGHNEELSALWLDELPDGQYTLVLMGIGTVNDPLAAVINVPDRIESAWFPRITSGKICDNEYFHAAVAMTVKAGVAQSPRVVLKRIVARVDIIPAYENGMWSEGSLQEAVVSFDEGSELYSTHTASGRLDGPLVFKGIDVIKSLSFYTLTSPHAKKLSGTVSLKGTDNGGKQITFSYNFSLAIEANKVAVIRPAYVADDNQFGTIRFYDRDRRNHTVTRFFQDGDSYKSIFQRSFCPMQPITLAMRGKQLVVSCYVAKTVKDVGIYMTQGNSGIYFEVARLEHIDPYEEIFINIDQLPERKLYRTEAGGVVMVEKLLLSSATKFRYNGSDPFIQAIRDIRWNVRIQFVAGDTITFAERGLCLRPIHARGAVALFTNMGYVITSPKWIDRMKSLNIYNDSKVPVSIDNELMPKILTPNSNFDHLMVNVLSPFHEKNANLGGLSNVGNGDYYCLEEPSFTRFITEDRYPRTTCYHEFGHVMGYSHNSNLTYGEMETVSKDIAGVYKALGQLPYNATPEAIGSSSTLYSVMRPI